MPDDLVVVRTADGSSTLDSPALGEHFHSLFGAVTESRHVYIRNGLHAMGKTKLDILEVGLGTGLNALLTCAETITRGLDVNYTALEPFPLPKQLWQAMGHVQAVGGPMTANIHEQIMDNAAGRWIQVGGGFIFRWLPAKVQQLDATGAFDLVYFDAFAPGIQPGMWTAEVFRRMHRAMRPGAILVTYCAKGAVRRAMGQAGLATDRLPGPPGKREMLRAMRMQ